MPNHMLWIKVHNHGRLTNCKGTSMTWKGPYLTPEGQPSLPSNTVRLQAFAANLKYRYPDLTLPSSQDPCTTLRQYDTHPCAHLPMLACPQTPSSQARVTKCTHTHTQHMQTHTCGHVHTCMCMCFLDPPGPGHRWSDSWAWPRGAHADLPPRQEDPQVQPTEAGMRAACCAAH